MILKKIKQLFVFLFDKADWACVFFLNACQSIAESIQQWVISDMLKIRYGRDKLVEIILKQKPLRLARDEKFRAIISSLAADAFRVSRPSDDFNSGMSAQQQKDQFLKDNARTGETYAGFVLDENGDYHVFISETARVHAKEAKSDLYSLPTESEIFMLRANGFILTHGGYGYWYKNHDDQLCLHHTGLLAGDAFRLRNSSFILRRVKI